MKAKLLLVDDDQMVLRALTCFLQDDYEVTPVSTGAQALAALRAGSYDLAIVDLHLHEQNGLEVRENLLTLQPSMWVIVMTGGATPEEWNRLKSVTTIDKPFKLEELAEVLLGPRK